MYLLLKMISISHLSFPFWGSFKVRSNIACGPFFEAKYISKGPLSSEVEIEWERIGWTAKRLLQYYAILLPPPLHERNGTSLVKKDMVFIVVKLCAKAAKVADTRAGEREKNNFLKESFLAVRSSASSAFKNTIVKLECNRLVTTIWVDFSAKHSYLMLFELLDK